MKNLSKFRRFDYWICDPDPPFISIFKVFVISLVLAYIAVCLAANIHANLQIYFRLEPDVLKLPVNAPKRLVYSEDPGEYLSVTGFYAMAEEFIFRLVPAIFFGVGYMSQGRGSPQKARNHILTLVCMYLVGGLAFGLLHYVNNSYTMPMVLYGQTVLGVVFTTIFLKCGGTGGKYLQALLISSLAHFVWNTVLGTHVWIQIFAFSER